MVPLHLERWVVSSYLTLLFFRTFFLTFLPSFYSHVSDLLLKFSFIALPSTYRTFFNPSSFTQCTSLVTDSLKIDPTLLSHHGSLPQHQYNSRSSKPSHRQPNHPSNSSLRLVSRNYHSRHLSSLPSPSKKQSCAVRGSGRRKGKGVPDGASLWYWMKSGLTGRHC